MENVVKMLKALWWLLIAMLLIYIMSYILTVPLNGSVENMTAQAKEKTITLILFTIFVSTALVFSVAYLGSVIPKPKSSAPMPTHPIGTHECLGWMRDDRGYMRTCEYLAGHSGPHIRHAIPQSFVWEGTGKDALEIEPPRRPASDEDFAPPQ